MSWASYESVPTMTQSQRPPPPQNQMKPMMQYKPENPAYTQAEQKQPEQKQPEQKQPEQQRTTSKWADISEYEEINDWVYIFLGIFVSEVILIFLVRLFPEVFGKYLNIWYNRFKLSAVLADVFIIGLAIGVSRYVYTEFIYPKHDWSALYFTATTVVVQILHDILFYIGVIQQVPKGHNAMIDVMKEYASSLGSRAFVGDSVLTI